MSSRGDHHGILGKGEKGGFHGRGVRSKCSFQYSACDNEQKQVGTQEAHLRVMGRRRACSGKRGDEEGEEDLCREGEECAHVTEGGLQQLLDAGHFFELRVRPVHDRVDVVNVGLGLVANGEKGVLDVRLTVRRSANPHVQFLQLFSCPGDRV